MTKKINRRRRSVAPSFRRDSVSWRAQIRGKSAQPPPIANQLACCRYVSGYADDINPAKAVVAVEGNGLRVSILRLMVGYRYNRA